MANANKVIFMGHLTRDPEITFTPKGTQVANFGMASNRYFKKEDGTKGEDATFLELVAYGRHAENLKQFVVKGDPLYIEGRLKFETWEDKATGSSRSKLKVIIENFQLLGNKPKAGEEVPLSPQEDDDIPF